MEINLFPFIWQRANMGSGHKVGEFAPTRNFEGHISKRQGKDKAVVSAE
jgi:hypothetical protein